MSQSKYTSEGFSKLWIEDCVDDRVYTGVDVTKEGCGLEGKAAWRSVQVVFYAESVQNVASEEWNPANEETH